MHFIGKLSMPLRHHRQTCKIYKGIKEVAIQIRMTVKGHIENFEILKIILEFLNFELLPSRCF